MEIGKLVLRVAVGALLLLHGLAKIRHGVGSIVASVAVHGVPGALGYLVFVGEVLAPILLLLGQLTRPAAVAIAINMAVAIALMHTGDLWHLGRGGGYALELQALYLFGALSVALFGAGRYSVSRGAGRFN
jgi:putative oxidoreductase